MKTAIADLDGPVAWTDFGGEGRPLVLVHGLGGSTVNWLAVAPALTRFGRVVALDLVGFGRTPPARRSFALETQRRVLDRFLDDVVREPAILVGNSMGGVVSMQEAAAAPGKVAGLILVDPSQPLPAGRRMDPKVLALFSLYAIPFVGQAFVAMRSRRAGARGLVELTLRLCCVDPNRVPREVFDAHVELATERLASMRWASAAFVGAARSLVTFLLRRKRYAAMVAAIRAPALLVQGAQDRLVPLAASRALARAKPDWVLEVIDDCGHVPQLETPERFLQVVSRWLERPERAAAGA